MKWKITTKIPKEKIYLDPEKVILELVNCKLHNNRTQADKIFEGGHKRVCSWVECDDILILAAELPDEYYGTQIHYNPKKYPHWVDSNGHDLDGYRIDKLITKGNKIYTGKRARVYGP
jgi:hypothetical protein